MAHTASSMDTPQMPDATYQPQQTDGPDSFAARPFNAYASLYHFLTSDHLPQNLPPVVSQAFWPGSVPSSGATVDYSENAEAIVEHAHPGADGAVAVEDQLNECEKVPCPTRTEGRKRSRKRGRDWTDEETWVLVECKRACFEDKGSLYRKHKSSATNWEGIAEAVRDSPETCGASEKTGDQCRLRWDTLVKSHRLIKERCVDSGKEHAEVMAEDTRSLKLATTLKREWYEVVDSISGKSRSRKESNPGARKSKNGGEGAGPVIAACMARTGAGSHSLVLENAPALGGGSIPAAPGCPGMSKPKRKAAQRFWSLGPQLRSTLLDLIHGFLDEVIKEDKSLSRTCEWLSAVQSRSRSDVYDDVSMLMQMRLVHVSNEDEYCKDGDVRIEWSGFRVLEKFEKKLIGKNPVLDTHRFLVSLDHIKLNTLRESLTPHRIRVLTLRSCKVLASIDLRGLRKLRSLYILDCGVLKEITGWKYLRELGWLKIFGCRAYADYLDLRDLPSLRVCILGQSLDDSVDLGGRKFDISQCVRLRRLEICEDETLIESGDLSSLKCLEELVFCWCTTLLTVDGLSGLHSLTRLVLDGCKALRSLPDIGHMKELAHIDLCDTSVEEIPGIEKLVSLKTLDCDGSKLKHLPDLHHLPMLQWISLVETPLIEDDPSSFYFDKREVSFNREEKSVLVEVSDTGDDEAVLSEPSGDEDVYSG